MENLDIILLTTIVAILFLVFIIATFKEIAEDAKNPHKGGKERGPRADMMEFVGRIFSDDRIELAERKELLNMIKKRMDDIDVNMGEKDGR
jgi:hypothetical protein